ncbi:phage portal protein [Mycolicibacterium neoaurum]|uniref:phage portal protein n=1 Tax=Mycolicibacterium neoaurum TaxID=1795 RepID=UPI001F4CCCEC|nr:phage portal protein [Mycolicibacterium neoaurum]
MASKKAPLRVRLATRILGKNKAFIPHLSNTLDLFDPANPLRDYATKQEALLANIGWAFAANDAIARPMAQVKLVLYKVDKNGDKTELPDSHPVMKLIRKPNAALRGKQFRRLHVGYMNFTGESYNLMLKGNDPFVPKLGQLPDSIHVLPAHLVDFKLVNGDFSASTVQINNESYSIDEIIRDIDPDPRDPFRGQSRITKAAATIDTDEQMKDWNRRFFKNNARPGLIFSTKEEMSDEAYARWQQQFADGHAGTENAYKNLLVENGDAKPYMVSQQDLDFLASRKFSMAEICAMFNVSPAVIGWIEDANKSILEGALLANMRDNVIPRVEDFCELQNESWIQMFDPNLELGFINPIGEDKNVKLAENDKAANKWKTIDEVREDYGLEPLPDGLGAQLYVQGSLRTLGKVAAATDTPTGSAGNPNDPSGDETVEDDEDQDKPPAEGKKSVPKPKAA